MNDHDRCQYPYLPDRSRGCGFELSKEVGKHRIKFDLQIVAVSKVHRSAVILSDDPGVKKLADLLGVPCRGIADLPLPADPDQTEMFDDW